MERFIMKIKGTAESCQMFFDVVSGNGERSFNGIKIDSVQKIKKPKHLFRYEIIGNCSDSIELSMCICNKTSLREESESLHMDIDVQSLEEDVWDDGHFHFRNGEILSYPRIDYEEEYGFKGYDYSWRNLIEE